MQKIDRILRLPEVMELTSVKKSTIYNYLKTGDFPSQVKLTKKSVGWRESTIIEWINSRKKTNVDI